MNFSVSPSIPLLLFLLWSKQTCANDVHCCATNEPISLLTECSFVCVCAFASVWFQKIYWISPFVQKIQALWVVKPKTKIHNTYNHYNYIIEICGPPNLCRSLSRSLDAETEGSPLSSVQPLHTTLILRRMCLPSQINQHIKRIKLLSICETKTVKHTHSSNEVRRAEKRRNFLTLQTLKN